MGPPAISFSDYARETRHSFRNLLDSDPPECDVQKFLEQNPSIVPGALTPGSPSGHYPLHCLLISQPRLTGLSTKIPDFMWIATHSAKWFPTLIEIEQPSKPLFRKDLVPTAQFTQARDQLADWRAWFNDPANRLVFQNEYGIPEKWVKRRTMQLHMILVYGRRRDFENDPVASKKRSVLMPGSDEELMSFDRLEPDASLSDALTVRALGAGNFSALSVPATLELGPGHAERSSVISGVDKAIRANPGISEDRKNFLLGRLPYWEAWGIRDHKGIVRSGDRE